MMVALVLGLGAIAQAQEDTTEQEGRIVRIGPANDSQPAGEMDQEHAPRTWQRGGFGEEQSRPEPAGHWIGVMAGPVTPALRAHLDVPEGQGVMVHQVVPDSPAAKAGVKRFDILLRANDTELRDNNDLVDVVRTAGEQQQQITLEVLRGAQRETVWVTPAERPARPMSEGPAFGEEGDAFNPRDGENPFAWFGDRFRGRNGEGFDFRGFGPGAVLGGRAFGGHAEIPNGVAVSIQKQNDEPAHITVQRGDETWEVVGDDPKSLDQLPDDLRPFVEQLLGQTDQPGFNAGLPAMRGPQVIPRFGEHEAQLREQLQAMEERMRNLERHLRGPADAPADDSQ
jgi:hypothetical protein